GEDHHQIGLVERVQAGDVVRLVGVDGAVGGVDGEQDGAAEAVTPSQNLRQLRQPLLGAIFLVAADEYHVLALAGTLASGEAEPGLSGWGPTIGQGDQACEGQAAAGARGLKENHVEAFLDRRSKARLCLESYWLVIAWGSVHALAWANLAAEGTETRNPEGGTECRISIKECRMPRAQNYGVFPSEFDIRRSLFDILFLIRCFPFPPCPRSNVCRRLCKTASCGTNAGGLRHGPPADGEPSI